PGPPAGFRAGNAGGPGAPGRGAGRAAGQRGSRRTGAPAGGRAVAATRAGRSRRPVAPQVRAGVPAPHARRRATVTMRTAIARWPALVLCLCALAVAGDAAAAVRAWLDRDSVVLGETVTLNVEGDSAGVAPDFSVLARDFELLGTSSGTQVQIVNGQRSLVALRAVALRPLRAGTVTIPAF